MIDDEKTLLDLHLKMYLEHHVQRRHVEVQRSAIISGLTAISAAAIGIVTYDDAITAQDVPLSILLIMIGVFGAAFSIKLWERSEGHKMRAKFQRDAMDRLLGGDILETLKSDADTKHEKTAPQSFLLWLPTNLFWSLLPLGIAAIGGYLTLVAFGPIEAQCPSAKTSSRAVATVTKPAVPKPVAVPPR